MGHEGMRASLVSREVICDSVETVIHAERFDGFVGLAGCDKTIPGDADGRRPPRPAQRVRLQRLDHAGRAQRRRARHHERVRGGRCVRRRHDHRGGTRRDRAQGMPGRRCLRWHVHRQHHEFDRRGHRPQPAGHGVAAGHRRSTRGRRSPRRRGGGQHAAARHHAAPDHDQAGVRERDRRHLGARWLHQRSAAPAGHRQRGPRRARPRRLQPHRRPGAAHRRHEAGRQVPHERPRPRRRRTDGAQAPARRRAAARRRHDGDRQDDGGEPRRDRPAATRRRRRLPARPADPSARVGSTC